MLRKLLRFFERYTISEEWIARWDRACGKCWAILTNGEPTPQRVDRFVRNHERLMKLSRRKRGLYD